MTDTEYYDLIRPYDDANETASDQAGDLKPQYLQGC